MASDIVEVHHGLGRHQNYLTAHQLQEFQKYTYGEWIQTFATLMWTKVSICLFLLRIPCEKYLIGPLQGALVFLVLSNVVLTLLWIFQCRPIAAVWDMTIDGTCFKKRQVESIILVQACKLGVHFEPSPSYSLKPSRAPREGEKNQNTEKPWMADSRGLPQWYLPSPISPLRLIRLCFYGKSRSDGLPKWAFAPWWAWEFCMEWSMFDNRFSDLLTDSK